MSIAIRDCTEAVLALIITYTFTILFGTNRQHKKDFLSILTILNFKDHKGVNPFRKECFENLKIMREHLYNLINLV